MDSPGPSLLQRAAEIAKQSDSVPEMLAVYDRLVLAGQPAPEGGPSISMLDQGAVDDHLRAFRQDGTHPAYYARDALEAILSYADGPRPDPALINQAIANLRLALDAMRPKREDCDHPALQPSRRRCEPVFQVRANTTAPTLDRFAEDPIPRKD